MIKITLLHILLLLTSGYVFASQITVMGCDISGYILAKGNSIYVPTDAETEYDEKVGQLRLKTCLQQWGYWNIVESIDCACCVIQYVNYTDATPDVAFVVIRHRDFYILNPILTPNYSTNYYGVYMGSVHSGETIEENINAANIFYKRLKAVILEGNSKVFSIFHKGNDKALNINSDENTKAKTIIINYEKFGL